MSDSEEIQDNNSSKSDEECSLSLSCASSEFVDDFDEADNELLGVLPYQFEPTYADSEEIREADEAQDNTGRLGNTDW